MERHLSQGHVTIQEAQAALDELQSALSEEPEQKRKPLTNKEKCARYYQKTRVRRKRKKHGDLTLEEELDWVYRNFRLPGILPKDAPTLAAGAWMEHAQKNPKHFLTMYKADVERRQKAQVDPEEANIREWTDEQAKLIEEDLREIAERSKKGAT